MVTQNPHERNFHIFYQVIQGIDGEAQNTLGITSPDYYNYLNAHDCYAVRIISAEFTFRQVYFEEIGSGI